MFNTHVHDDSRLFFGVPGIILFFSAVETVFIFIFAGTVRFGKEK